MAAEELRTTLWLVPTLLVAASVLLFAITYGFDVARLSRPPELPLLDRALGPDAARQVLIAIAAAVITVVGRGGFPSPSWPFFFQNPGLGPFPARQGV